MNLQLILQTKLFVLRFIQSNFLIDLAEKLKLNESTLKRLLSFVDRDDFENAIQDLVITDIAKRKNINLVNEWNTYLSTKRNSMKGNLNKLGSINSNRKDLEKIITNSLNNL